MGSRSLFWLNHVTQFRVSSSSISIDFQGPNR